MRTAPFGSRGVVQLSGGDSTLSGGAGDLGTAFALATTLSGARELQFSGNVGYAGASGAPATAFRTRYTSLGGQRTPDVEFTVRELGGRERMGQALLSGAGAAQALPALRSYSLKLQDRQNFGARLRLDYGLMMEAVAFLDTVNVASPFAKLSLDLGSTSGLEAAFSSGAPGPELFGAPQQASLQQDSLSGLTAFPRVSLMGGAAQMQRSTDYELGYHMGAGATTLRASVYSERMRNESFLLGGNTSALSTGDLLPDAASNSSIFNFGNFQSTGYLVSAARPVGSQWTAMVLYGAGGALRTDASELPADSAVALRDRMRMAPAQWGSTRVSGILPKLKSYVSAAYIWTPAGRLIPTHAFLTQNWQSRARLELPVPPAGARALRPLRPL